MKYIDSEKLIAEIERRREKCADIAADEKNEEVAEYYRGKEVAYDETSSLINSLQQEQPQPIDQICSRAGIPVPYMDGNQWCILKGDNIQVGVVGFGDTKEDALVDFIKNIPIQQEQPDGYNRAMLEVKAKVDKLYDETSIGLNEYDAGLYNGIIETCMKLRGFIKARISSQGQPETSSSLVDVDAVREDFITNVYRVLDADPTNDRANAIIDAFDSLPTVSNEKPEVDLEEAARHVYESWMGGTMDDVRRDMAELGKVLNARKEE